MINKDISLLELLQTYPQLSATLQELGMGCCHCMGVMTETLEQGIKAHGLNTDEILQKLNEIVKENYIIK